MLNFTHEEYKNSKIEIEKIVKKCEEILPKFKVGTSQHTLLVNRINALLICNDLLEMETTTNQVMKHDFSIEEIKQSLAPIESIIHKCKKAQSKYEIGSTQYNRYIKMINTMSICKTLIEYKVK